jgi:xanthine dehydrogenase accessory factor
VVDGGCDKLTKNQNHKVFRLKMTNSELMAQLAADLNQGLPRILCQVVETRGSTPQKAGACMMIAPDGRHWGTLGGGCVENEVKQQSLIRLEPGQTRINTFVLDHDYAWADGLICGGRMVISSQNIADQSLAQYCERWVTLDQSGFGFREAIVHDASNPWAAETGLRVLVDHLGQAAASWPNNADPSLIRFIADSSVTTQKPLSSKGLSIIQWPARVQLVIVGAGHVGQAVGELAARTGFDVIVVDDRSEFANRERFPAAYSIHVGSFEETLRHIEISARTYALIVTRGHGHDQEALGLLADTPAAYVGLIGSRRKIKMIVEALQEEGVSESALSRVRAPIGLPIGSQSVDEIAVSVVAELIAWRNLGESEARRLAGPSAHLRPGEPTPEHTRAEVAS